MAAAVSSCYIWKAFGGVVAALAVGLSLQALYRAENERLVEIQLLRLRNPTRKYEEC